MRETLSFLFWHHSLSPGNDYLRHHLPFFLLPFLFLLLFLLQGAGLFWNSEIVQREDLCTLTDLISARPVNYFALFDCHVAFPLSASFSPLALIPPDKRPIKHREQSAPHHSLHISCFFLFTKNRAVQDLDKILDHDKIESRQNFNFLVKVIYPAADKSANSPTASNSKSNRPNSPA